MSFFEVSHLSAGYGAARILCDVSFSVERGSLTGILGANGSGKTTLLKAVCGVLPSQGTCTLNGTALSALSPRALSRLVSYIPQRSGISIDISALDVVLMSFNPRLGLLEQPSSSMRQAALHALEQVGLAGREHTNYLHLSEGQKQLCILARTLVAGTSLLLLDEPESALDFRFRSGMLSLLRRIVRENQSAAIIALHDPSLALNFCDQLLLLTGEGVCAIKPQQDAIASMERALSSIYGAVSLQTVQTRGGKKQLIMLKEEEE